PDGGRRPSRFSDEPRLSRLLSADTLLWRAAAWAGIRRLATGGRRACRRCVLARQGETMAGAPSGADGYGAGLLVDVRIWAIHGIIHVYFAGAFDSACID